MTHDTLNCYFSFWANFRPLTPLAAQKLKISKKQKQKKQQQQQQKKQKKTSGDIIIIHMCTINYD